MSNLFCLVMCFNASFCHTMNVFFKIAHVSLPSISPKTKCFLMKFFNDFSQKNQPKGLEKQSTTTKN